MALVESEAPRDPLTLFRRWYRDAQDAGAPQPDAMTLATCGEEGPSARMVLLKGIEDGAFLFYTNYGSRKGRDLAADKSAALVFYWSVTHHQVRVSGTVRRLSRKMSQAYFATRPRGAQLSALASRQSRVVKSRDVLDRAMEHLTPRERAIMAMRFYEQMSQSEIARRLGISQMHVSRLQRAALEQLRKYVPEETAS